MVTSVAQLAPQVQAQLAGLAPDASRTGASVAEQRTALLAQVDRVFAAAAEFDLLRDSGEAYGRRLQEAGVPTTISRHIGHVHGSGLLLVGNWEPAREWRNEIIGVLRSAFAMPAAEA